MSDAAEIVADTGAMTEERALRVLLVVEAAAGGTGRHVVDLASGLCRRGHDVSLVYCPRRAEQEFVRQVRNIQSLSLHPHDMGHVGIRALTQTLALRGWLGSTDGFDVAHAHSSKAGGMLRLALLGRDTPCVYTPHALVTLNPDLGVIPSVSYRVIERLLAERSSAIICVSEHERQHAERLGVPGAKLHVVHNGIAGVPVADRTNARNAFGIRENEICIGTVGRLAPQKAIDRLITAFGLICGSQLDLRLVIVGEGPERANLMQRVAELGIKNRVVFARSDHGSSAMAAFDVFALTSVYESFPYVLLEAAWRGLPIVMAETGGAGVVVRDGENGYVCRQNDVEFIASRLRELTKNRGLRSKMGARSMELVTQFRVDPMVESTISIYREAIRAKNR